jgi:uncharacterized membrane protein
MTGLALALAAFLLTHGLPAVPAVRGALVRRLGRGGYVFAFSVLSLAVIWWVADAYAAAPVVPLWTPEPWTRLVPLAVMPVACILFVGGFLAPNPLSLGRGGKGFDPERPGLLRLTRHPILWALILWSAAHLPPNGDAAAVMVFGAFLALSLPGPLVLDAKRRRQMDVEWHRLAANTSRPATLSPAEIGWPPVLGGLALFALLLALHPSVIGVSPLPQ